MGSVGLDYYRSGPLKDLGAAELDLLHSRNAERLLELGQRNGGLCCKFGQHLAQLEHILPPTMTKPLTALQDKQPALPPGTARAAVAEALGRPVEDVFAEWVDAPIGAASIAQVHRAVRADGREVAVKVQYPNLEQEVAWDFFLLRYGAAFHEYLYPEHSLSWLVPEFEDTVRYELDGIQEGVNAERASQMLAHLPNLAVPAVHWDLTSQRVLVMDFVHGARLDDGPAVDAILDRSGATRRQVGRTITSAFASMIYEHGLVHCDPHFGNFILRERGGGGGGYEVVLLDHGMYRRLEPAIRRSYCALWRAMMVRDAAAGARATVGLGLGEDSYPLLSFIYVSRLPGTHGAKASVSELKQARMGRIFATPEERSEWLRRLPRDLLFTSRVNALVRGLATTLGLDARDRWIANSLAAARGLLVQGAPTFSPSRHFDGQRPGFVFRTGPQGMGYYRDWACARPVQRPRGTLNAPVDSECSPLPTSLAARAAVARVLVRVLWNEAADRWRGGRK